jgi:Zn-dependent peptidase ImmA (M78 family)
MINRKIENLAFKVLKDLNITSPEEINLNKLCNFYGVQLEYKRLENNISGFYVVKNDRPYIVCNQNDSVKRQRFTIAHELGHHFLHKDTPLFVNKKGGLSSQIYHRNEESSTGEIRKEREANAFAAALLMPENLIEDQVFNCENTIDIDDLINDLAEKFDVSTQAMSFRLANLGRTTADDG